MPKPFKGVSFYEWQIGSWVFMWRHVPRSAWTHHEKRGFHRLPPGHPREGKSLYWELWIGRFLVWNDPKPS